MHTKAKHANIFLCVIFVFCLSKDHKTNELVFKPPPGNLSLPAHCREQPLVSAALLYTIIKVFKGPSEFFSFIVDTKIISVFKPGTCQPKDNVHLVS